MYLTKNFMDKEFLQLNNKINKETCQINVMWVPGLNPEKENGYLVEKLVKYE